MLNLKGNTSNKASHGLIDECFEKRYVSYTNRCNTLTDAGALN